MNDFESPHERVCACKPKDRRFYRFMAGVPGEPGTQGERGRQGERGTVFTPAVDEAGNLTWTNDGGLPNPATVNIRGPRSLPGEGGEPFAAEYGVTPLHVLDTAYEAGKTILVHELIPFGIDAWYSLAAKTRYMPEGGDEMCSAYIFAAYSPYGISDSALYVCRCDAGGWSKRKVGIASFDDLLQFAVRRDQGQENAGKTLTVGADGLVTPTAQSGTVRKGTVTLSAQWDGDGLYTQRVTVPGITLTAGSKVDLQPDMEAIGQLAGDGVCALYVENNNGTLTACAAGAAPSSALTLQCTVTEVRA